MKYKIKAYNLQELGQRQNQEDSLFPALGKSTSDDRLFVLCDGMGGHEKVRWHRLRSAKPSAAASFPDGIPMRH